MSTLRTALSLAVKISQLSSPSLSPSVPIIAGYPTFVYMAGIGLGYNLQNSSSIYQQCLDSTSKVIDIIN
jgi:hypothetical protein